MMNEHLDELSKVTELEILKLSKDESDLELERTFVSKLTNLQDLRLCYSCNISIVRECAKMKTLTSVNNAEGIEEFLQCPSKIKFFNAYQYLHGNNREILFNVDWPLEELILSGGNHKLSSASYISLLNNKTITRNLKKLAITEYQLENRVLELFKNLECIQSLSCRLNDDQAKYISKLATLKEILVRFSDVNDEGAQYISMITNLEKLILSFGRINGSGLSNFGKLTNITWLQLNNNFVGNEGANYLSAVTSLKYLDLNRNNISDEGLRNYGKLVNLTRLDLWANQIGNIGADYLSSIPNLTYIILNENQIEAEGLIHFGNLSKLEYLYLNKNKIGNGFKYLASFESLSLLDVGMNNICENDVIDYCKQWKSKRNCYQLTISGNKIGNRAFSKLAQLGFGVIDASNCKITDGGIIKLLKTCPPKLNLHLCLKFNKLTNSSLKAMIEFEGNIKKIFGGLALSDSSEFDDHLKMELSKILPLLVETKEGTEEEIEYSSEEEEDDTSESGSELSIDDNEENQKSERLSDVILLETLQPETTIQDVEEDEEGDDEDRPLKFFFSSYEQEAKLYSHKKIEEISSPVDDQPLQEDNVKSSDSDNIDNHSEVGDTAEEENTVREVTESNVSTISEKMNEREQPKHSFFNQFVYLVLLLLLLFGIIYYQMAKRV